jgi:hypothetical protein
MAEHNFAAKPELLDRLVYIVSSLKAAMMKLNS